MFFNHYLWFVIIFHVVTSLKFIQTYNKTTRAQIQGYNKTVKRLEILSSTVKSLDKL